MAEPEGSKSVLFSIVRGASAMQPEQQFRYLYTEINRMLALISTELENMTKRITAIEKVLEKL